VTSIADCPTVRLELESKPETLTLVRAVLGGVAELLSIDPELLDDLKTATSEAANNVVMHAYEGTPGPMSMCIYVLADEIEVVIRDRGGGMLESSPADDRIEGVGLPIIRALTTRAEFAPADGRGTEVRMWFAGRREGKVLFKQPGEAAPDDDWSGQLSGDAIVSLSPIAVLSGVLGRLARALAAGARFSLDRFSDVYLVTDAIAAHAADAAQDHRIAFGILAQPRRLELTIGPFRSGSGAPLRDQRVGNIGSPLLRLVDELQVEASNGGEKLRVVLVDQRR
jgi:serine/threonine-protein kinase RsbW